VALADAFEQIMRDSTPRILTYDVETSPIKAYTWQLFDATISPDMVIEPSRVLCFAAKWYDQGKIIFHAEWDDTHAQMIQHAWELLDAADIIVTFNGVGFDDKHLAREFLMAGLGPPSPWQAVDLLKVARQRFKFPSNRLGQVGQTLGIGAKLETGGWKLWQDVLDGDKKARDKFAKYNRQDVRLTEQLFTLLAGSGWIKGLPHAGLWSGDMAACYACGDTNLIPDGIAYTKTTRHVRLACACGAYSKVMKNGQTRPA
jgi:DNA polymerase elongation subunit (family B)